MSYTAEINRANPSCIVFVLDQSSSMADPIGSYNNPEASATEKQHAAADAINRSLTELSRACLREEPPRIYHYFDVAVVGYGASVGSAFGGSLQGQTLVPISTLGDEPLDVEQREKKTADGAGGLVTTQVPFPVWFKPTAQGGTPMCAALENVRSTLENWIASHPDAFPPMVLNITDGEATDGDPMPAAEAIRKLSTTDGNVLMFNLHMSETNASAIYFPDSEAGLPNDFARKLFSMSSTLPPSFREGAQKLGYPVSDGSRGFVFNADLVALVNFIEIGTQFRPLR
jgi:hypothetical protein